MATVIKGGLGDYKKTSYDKVGTVTEYTKYNKKSTSQLEKTYKENEKKLLQLSKQLKNKYDEAGIVTSSGNTLWGGYQVLPTTDRIIYLTDLAERKVDYRKYSTLSQLQDSGISTKNAVDIDKDIRANQKKFEEMTKTEEIQTDISNIKNIYDETANIYYQYLNQKLAEDDIGIYDKTLGRIVDSVKSFDSGGRYQLKNENGDYYRGSTYTDLKQQKVLDSYGDGVLGTIGKIMSSALYEGGRIATTSAINYVLPGVGTATYYANIFEKQANSAVAEGYDSKQALAYASLGTATEVITSKILGGTANKIFGTGNSELSKSIGNVMSRVIKNHPRVVNTISNAIAEGGEEFLQEYVDKVNRTITLNEDWRNIVSKETFEDALYSAAVGSLTGAYSGATDGTNYSAMANQQNQANQNKILNTTDESTTQNVANNLLANKIQQNNLQNGVLPRTQSNQSSYVVKNSAIPGIKYQYVQSDNPQINNFRKSAVAENFSNAPNSINLLTTIEKVIADKDYNVVFDSSITNNQGQSVNAQISNTENGIEIRLNPNSERVGEFLLVHEITHAIETDQMKQLVLDYASKHSDFNQVLESLKQTYGTNDINSEVLADISGQLLGNREFINSLTTQNTQQSKSIIKQIYESITRLLNKLTSKGRYRNFVQNLENKWREAYRNTTTEQSINNFNGDVKYHTNKDISQNIDNVLNNIYERNPVKLRDYTPSILVQNGIKDLPMYENPSHIRKNILTSKEAQNLGLSVMPKDHYHGLGKDLYIKAIDSLDNPRVIFKRNNSNEYLILTTIKDNNNNNIVIPIEIETTTNVNNIKIDTNRIKTVYGYDIKNPDLNEYIKHNLNNNEFKKIYEQKKERGTDNSTVASSLTVNNIPQSNNNVKSDISTNSNTQNSENNSQWQEYLEKNYKATGTRTKFEDVVLPKTKSKAPKLSLKKQDNILKLDVNQIADEINGTNKLSKEDIPKGKQQRKWSETSTNSELLKDVIGIKDLDVEKITYVPISNKKTMENATKKLNTMTYEESLSYIKGQVQSGNASLTDIGIAESLIAEAKKKGDLQTVADLLMDVSILGTELGQKVQALSIIQKMTPEGQLKMYQKIIQRSKAKGSKVFEDVEITPQMVETVLGAYNSDGTYDQNDLNARMETFKQQVADQMKTTKGEKINEWRYLAMLGNPETHIRNFVSNVAMFGTLKVKNAMARTMEMVLPQSKRTKTWKSSSDYIKQYANDTANEWKSVISGEAKYNETQQLAKKKKTFKTEALNKISSLNSKALEYEDWVFSKTAFKNTLQEYLTAQGIRTEQDIKANPEIVEKAKIYALQQAEIATFRQYSWLANKINEIERKNTGMRVLVGAVIPFKKTPINVAKAGINYSPLGLAKTLTYDIVQLKNGNMEASQFVDNLAQGLTGTSLTLLGYALAKAGFITGSGDDDKESKYDSALGNQQYALKLGNNTYSISWLSPVAMPLLVGANAFSELEENEEWDANIVMNTLASTLDPISEMSFISSLTDVLQSYSQGSMQMISNMGQSAINSYVTQFFPTLFSQIAATFDDKKRSTRADSDSSFKFASELWNQIKYKIPGARNTLPIATDIWGNDQEQADNVVQRALENFIAPWTRKEVINSDLDKELKRVYAETGNSSVIPGTPYSYINYKNEKYNMNNEEYTNYKKTYGSTAYEYLKSLINCESYKNATEEEKLKMIEEMYSYASATAKNEFFENRGIEYETDDLKILNDFERLNMDCSKIAEYVSSNKLSSQIKLDSNLTTQQKKEKISNIVINSKLNDKQKAYLYGKYYSSDEELDNIISLKIPINQFIKLNSQDISGEYDTRTGKTISGSKKENYINYVNALKLSVPQKAILIKMQYNTYDSYDSQIVNYVNEINVSLNEQKVLLKSIGFDNYDKDVVNYITSQKISAKEKEKKLKSLGFTIRNGVVYW